MSRGLLEKLPRKNTDQRLKIPVLYVTAPQPARVRYFQFQNFTWAVGPGCMREAAEKAMPRGALCPSPAYNITILYAFA
jgi:hypothetical protein